MRVFYFKIIIVSSANGNSLGNRAVRVPIVFRPMSTTSQSQLSPERRPVPTPKLGRTIAKFDIDPVGGNLQCFVQRAAERSRQ